MSNSIKSDPRKFYKTFTPFLDVKNKQNAREDICLKIDQKLELDQIKLADHLAYYFSTIADGIGGTNVQNLTEDDFGNHVSIKHIAMTSVLNAASEELFRFKPLGCKQVQEAMKMLNPRKATGYDKIDPRILKIGAEELAHLPSLAFLIRPSQKEYR